MAGKVVYPTRINMSGPWLLEKAKLLDLDALIDKAFARMNEIRGAEIQSEAEARWTEMQEQKSKYYASLDEAKKQIGSRYPLGKLTREIKIGLRSKRNLLVGSFSEADANPELSRDIANSFNVSLEVGRMKCSIDLDEHDLTIEVRPEHIEESAPLMSSFQQWAENTQASWLVRSWQVANPIQWVVLIPLLLLCFGLGIKENTQWQSTLSERRAQAHELLKDGISENERDRAIETLLAIEAQDIPNPKPAGSRVELWVFVVGGLLVAVAILLTFTPPSSLLGLGHGARKVQAWNRWIIFVFVVVPGFLGSNFVVPKIMKLFE